MRIVFMGAGPLACPALRALLESKADEVVAVVTQPDRPSGRSRQVKPCEVKAFLQGRAVKLFTPESVNEASVIDQIKELAADLFVVADFGQMLKPQLLSMPPKGVVNIHPSLLPKYRGAAPIQWAMAHGEVETGVTVLYVIEKVDAGEVILQEKAPIREEDTAATMESLLAELGAAVLLRALDLIREDRATRTAQNEAEVSFARKLDKDDGKINWMQPAGQIRNRIRAFIPWPGCHCEFPKGSGHSLRVWSAKVEEATGEPGTILENAGDGPVVACGEKSLRLLDVQPESKKRMTGAAFLNGYRLRTGDKMG